MEWWGNVREESDLLLEQLFGRRRRLVRSDTQQGQSRTLFSQPVIPASRCFRRSSTGTRILRLPFVDHFLAAGETHPNECGGVYTVT